MPTYPDTRPPEDGPYLVVANFTSKYWQILQYTVEDGFGAGDRLIACWTYLPPLPDSLRKEFDSRADA